MTTLAPERVDELLVELRRGNDLADLDNPAGPRFADRYREYEITATGGTDTYWAFSNDSLILDGCDAMCC